MTGVQNRKGKDLQKPFPGCMGRMINIFDLSAGMTGTKLLTEKGHRDGSPVHRSQPDVAKKKATDAGVQIEDKLIASNLRKGSSKKLGGIPIKLLIAQEMSKETESKQQPTNVVAKLMGLEALPVHHSVLIDRRASQENYPHNTAAEIRQQVHGFYQNSSQCSTRSCAHDKEYKDVYEVRQQSSRNSQRKDQISQRGSYDENPTENRMELVRQKFIEAKRLATDEQLLQSKEFKEAVEVLSSNRDLFLKFLEEPNSLFSKHLYELQNVSSLSQAKSITVLKPAQINEVTRIVVLKPSPEKTRVMKKMVVSPIVSSRLLERKDFYAGLGADETLDSREVAKVITRQIQEYLISNQRDEALFSSGLSNGYFGDESSFSKSENEFIEGGDGDASDPEIVTPTSSYLCDYVNRAGSPYSISSFSRTSHSSESSVIKEAKKRLSERWAMIASNGIVPEQTQLRRSSSTLGEMLAIPEVKKEEGNDSLTLLSRRSCGSEQGLRLSAACLSTSGRKEECSEGPPRNLSRSKSVPVSSPAYGNIVLKKEGPNSLISKSIVPKETANSKGGKSSLKEKVSSLLFSRIKKAVREKPISPSLMGSSCRFHSSTAEAYHNSNDSLSKSFYDSHSVEHIEDSSEDKWSKTCLPLSSFTLGPKHNSSSAKASLALEKRRTSESSRENQDQPSPISVLEAPFEDDAIKSISRSSTNAFIGHPQALSRSSPIESVARTLTLDDTYVDMPPPSSTKLSKVLSKECEEQEQFAFYEKILSSSSLDDEESSTILDRWHSLESPLDPTLLDDLLDRKGEGAKCREKRSKQRLLFDCVNAALLDIGQATLIGKYPWATACSGALKGDQFCVPVSDEVWRLVRSWFYGEANYVFGENQNLVVDRVVKGEVAGRGWAMSMWFEIDEFSKEIGGEVLEDLVEEALADLSDEYL